MIGNNNIQASEPLEIRHSPGEGPYATKTPLGWTLNGPLGRTTPSSRCTTNLTLCDVPLDKQFRNFCSHEFNDSLIDVHTEFSQEDRKAISIMENTVHMTDDSHYEMALPFKSLPTYLPENRALADHRLKLLARRFNKDPDIHARYTMFVEQLFGSNYAEEVPPDQIHRMDGMVWFVIALQNMMMHYMAVILTLLVNITFLFHTCYRVCLIIISNLGSKLNCDGWHMWGRRC